MVAFPWSDAFGEDGLPETPAPDVEFVTSGTQPGEFTEAGIKGICMNPTYADIGEFPPFVSDRQWVAACKRIMERDTPEQFLVNLLFLLRSTLGYVGETPPDTP